nr:ArgE/DapE family deacylase [Herbaspirillum sp. RV1423]
MIETLSNLVAAASPSGDEFPAVSLMEEIMGEAGLVVEHVPLQSDKLSALPLYSPKCHEDKGRNNLLAFHQGTIKQGEPQRSVLFNGHLDVVPTGPEEMWTNPPFSPVLKDGWLHGRGSGDMKAGIICTLVALKALRKLGVQPKGQVGFNWVLEEECTGNGALASVVELQKAIGSERLKKFDAVIIPEPLGDGMVCAQVGVFWMQVHIAGKPAHAAMMEQGMNPIDAAYAVMADLRELEAEWNLPQHRHPAYQKHAHPINFNLGRIEGGEWMSSVPCTCKLGVRIGVFPGVDIAEAKAIVAARVQATIARIKGGLKADISYEGFHAPGVEFDLAAPALQALGVAHAQINGYAAASIATTATTDARHFQMMLDVPVTCYGPQARNIHGIDEAVSIESMQRVSATLALFLQNWCGVEPILR